MCDILREVFKMFWLVNSWVFMIVWIIILVGLKLGYFFNLLVGFFY